MSYRARPPLRVTFDKMTGIKGLAPFPLSSRFFLETTSPILMLYRHILLK